MYRPRYGMKASGLARWTRNSNRGRYNNYKKPVRDFTKEPMTEGETVGLIIFTLFMFVIIMSLCS